MPLMTVSFDLDLEFGELKRWLTENGLLQVAIGDYTRDQVVAMVHFILAETTVRKEGSLIRNPSAAMPAQSLSPFPGTAEDMDQVPF